VFVHPVAERMAGEPLVQSRGGIGGFSGKRAQVTPSPTADCPVISDPLASQVAPPAGSCGASNTDKKVEGGVVSLPPGTYCGLTVTKGAQVTLQKDGIYVIKDGPLVVKNENVNLIRSRLSSPACSLDHLVGASEKLRRKIDA
jgi:hypothetical protein